MFAQTAGDALDLPMDRLHGSTTYVDEGSGWTRPGRGDVAEQPPSAYLRRFYYDTTLHDPAIPRWLAERVSIDNLVLGSDDSFPPADRTPMASLCEAGFSAAEIATIVESNPRALFPRLPPPQGSFGRG